MIILNPKIDNYLSAGCGRCDKVGTPACKVNTWREELTALRAIALDCGLTEELKWSMPCYTHENNNIVLISAFKDYCALTYFKGVLLKDPENILIAQTKNVQAARQVRFTSVAEVTALAPILKDYIQEAIEVEKSDLEVPRKKTEDFDMPEELQILFDEDPAFRQAFEALTPGRQRGYLLHFSGAKQSKTRVSRIEKHMPRIFEGLGMHD